MLLTRRNAHMVLTAAVRHAEPFKNSTGTLRGVRLEKLSQGRMDPNTWILHKDTPVQFVIYNYDTPIAWMTAKGEWVMPTDTYSKTTTAHQNMIRGVLGV